MAYDVARFLSIDEVDSPSFTPGGRLLFLSDTSGTPQVWTTDAAGAWPERLTPYEERVSTVAPSRTREEFVFGMDRGSDERNQLYRYDLRDGTETPLTDAPEAKHAWGDWSPDGQRVAYSANRRDPGVFDVYVQGREESDDDAELVLEGEGGWLTVDTWLDEDRLVLAKPRSSNDTDLYLLDADAGERVRLSDDDETRFPFVEPGPDGDLYVVTDHGSDTAYLGRIDLSGVDPSEDDTDAEIETVVAGGDWNVNGLAVHESGRIAWTRNVDGYSELHAGRLVDGGGSIRETAAPSVDGVVTGLTFGPDGERYAFTHTENTQPYGVHVAQFGTVADERVTPGGTAGIPPSTFRAAETVRYETFDDREIPAYWTLPEDAEEAETPVIVDIHGGPTHQRRPWFYPTKQFFINRGYAVLEPNVRGSTGYGKAYTHLDDQDKRMDSVRDIQQAVEWLHDQPEVDADRIVAYGRSYGGFMVLAAITEYPDLWAAAVDFVGIANFETFLENTGEWRRSHREAEYGSLENRELLERISPIHRADRIQCQLFVQHGANDPRVPVSEAEQIAETVREQGVSVETLIFEDEGHHTTSRDNLIEEFEAIADFLDRYV
ncbi:S9 family peptidase [Halobacteriales archaeon QS_1_68_20]|nr:MAG: S9 family peptidase [Halobacteriales archaeon QS_1_68_20]